MSLWERIKIGVGMSDEDEEEYGGEYEDTDNGAYPQKDQQPEVTLHQPLEEERRITSREKAEIRNATKLSNVIGMPGIGGSSEMIVVEPRSFDEMPQVIDALRNRKSVILNMTLIRQEEAQRSVDFVAGGTYAIDGHNERIGDNIFLFTPNCVKVSTPDSVVNEIADRQVPIAPPTRSNRSSHNMSTWNGEPPSKIAQ